jgi:4-amino-4-deoxy-L-arabinose transferase-like glycosyltransferase
MSTPAIGAPSTPAASGAWSEGRARVALRRAVRGGEADPPWSRPALWLVALLAGALTLWGLTRNGYANTYYAEAAQAATRSWHALLTNALDVSGSDSLDKGPLPNVLMGLSGRVFGFSSFSVLLPEALCGIVSVLVLHNTVKRTLGHRAALLAALALALTPIFVAMSRFNNPDAVLVAMEVCAAWALVRALQSGRTRYLLLCGALVGLAFNAKMLAAYLVVPGLALAYILAGQGSLRRRVAQLAAGGASMVAVSFAWYATMMALPAGARPWVGDTTDNSWFSLIFGANGLSRVSGAGEGAGPGGGPGGGAGFGGAAGPLRMFNTIVGGQIAWLLPLALLGLVLGLWSRRGTPRTDLRRAAYLLWGGWGVLTWAVFSFSEGIFHPYYTTALAPAVAVLAAGGTVELWDRARGSLAWTLTLCTAICATAALAVVLLARASGFVPWLAPAVAFLAAASTLALLLARAPLPAAARAWLQGRRARIALRCAAIAGVAAMLAGPTAYSIATVGKTLGGGNPLAGPASAEAGLGFGGTGPGAFPGGRPRFPGARARGGFAPPIAPAGIQGFRAGGGPGGSVDSATLEYLKSHQGSARYMVAAVGSGTAASLALRSARNVIDMGGFMGSDPSPSLAQLKHLIATGQLHYVLLSRGGGPGIGGPGGGGAATGGSGGGAGIGGPGGGAGIGGPAGSLGIGGSGDGGAGIGGSGAGGASASATNTRDAWVESHGRAIQVGSQGSGGATLYFIPSSSAN